MALNTGQGKPSVKQPLENNTAMMDMLGLTATMD